MSVQEFAMDRPTMSYVISMLATETWPLPIPKQVAYSTKRNLAQESLPKLEESCSTSITIRRWIPAEYGNINTTNSKLVKEKVLFKN